MTVTKQPTDRFYFFDNLRYLVILTVVAVHVSFAYSKHIVPWWFIHDAHKSLAFDAFGALVDSFSMAIMFFISGFLAIPSLASQGPRLFIKKKLQRLIIPLLIGVIFIVPAYPYIGHSVSCCQSGQPPQSFAGWWWATMQSAATPYLGLIHTKENPCQFGHGQLWYLALLFFFLLVFCLLYQTKQARGKPALRAARTPGSAMRALLVVGCLSTTGFFAINLVVTDLYLFSFLNLLVVRAPSLAIFASYFCLGLYAYSRRWFMDGHDPGDLRLWLLVAVPLALGYLMLGEQVTIAPEPSLPARFMFAFFRSFFCLASTVILLTVAYRWWNWTSPANRALAGSSYDIYVIHLVIALLCNALILSWQIPAALKWALASAITIALSHLLSRYLIRPFPRLATLGLLGAFVSACLLLG